MDRILSAFAPQGSAQRFGTVCHDALPLLPDCSVAFPYNTDLSLCSHHINHHASYQPDFSSHPNSSHVLSALHANVISGPAAHHSNSEALADLANPIADVQGAAFNTSADAFDTGCFQTSLPGDLAHSSWPPCNSSFNDGQSAPACTDHSLLRHNAQACYATGAGQAYFPYHLLQANAGLAGAAGTRGLRNQRLPSLASDASFFGSGRASGTSLFAQHSYFSQASMDVSDLIMSEEDMAEGFALLVGSSFPALQNANPRPLFSQAHISNGCHVLDHAFCAMTPPAMQREGEQGKAQSSAFSFLGSPATLTGAGQDPMTAHGSRALHGVGPSDPLLNIEYMNFEDLEAAQPRRRRIQQGGLFTGQSRQVGSSVALALVTVEDRTTAAPQGSGHGENVDRLLAAYILGSLPPEDTAHASGADSTAPPHAAGLAPHQSSSPSTGAWSPAPCPEEAGPEDLARYAVHAAAATGCAAPTGQEAPGPVAAALDATLDAAMFNQGFLSQYPPPANFTWPLNVRAHSGPATGLPSLPKAGTWEDGQHALLGWKAMSAVPAQQRPASLGPAACIKKEEEDNGIAGGQHAWLGCNVEVGLYNEAAQGSTTDEDFWDGDEEDSDYDTNDERELHQDADRSRAGKVPRHDRATEACNGSTDPGSALAACIKAGGQRSRSRSRGRGLHGDDGSRCGAPGRPTKYLSLDLLKSVFHLEQADAAMQLNVGTTQLKSMRKEHGIKRWPFRKLNSLDTMIADLEKSIVESQAKGDAAIVPAKEQEIVYIRALKARIYAEPDVVIDEELVKRRQMLFKAKHSKIKAGAVLKRKPLPCE